jgi:hypothetical protein
VREVVCRLTRDSVTDVKPVPICVEGAAWDAGGQDDG